ncbi:hypothetical protein DIPPA_06149 [Diplonema papillatum]|nr:hypothetical protein DIPPA_06149 [Diplonema papillatum]
MSRARATLRVCVRRFVVESFDELSARVRLQSSTPGRSLTSSAADDDTLQLLQLVAARAEKPASKKPVSGSDINVANYLREMFANAFKGHAEMANRHKLVYDLLRCVEEFEENVHYTVGAKTYEAALSLVSASANPSVALRLYEKLLKRGLAPTYQALTSLLHCFASNGDTAGADHVIKELQREGLHPTPAIHKYLVICQANAGRKRQAWKLYQYAARRHPRSGKPPAKADAKSRIEEDVSLFIALGRCVSSFDEAVFVINAAQRIDPPPSERSWHRLVAHVYGGLASVSLYRDCLSLFGKVPAAERARMLTHEPLHAVVLRCHANLGDEKAARALFHDQPPVIEIGVYFAEYMTALALLKPPGWLDEVGSVYRVAQANGFERKPFLHIAMLAAYREARDAEAAETVFENLPKQHLKQNVGVLRGLEECYAAASRHEDVKRIRATITEQLQRFGSKKAFAEAD